MNENSKNAIDMAYDGDIASMQSAIEDVIKDKIASAFEYKKQEIAQQLINNEEKCCDELSSKQKKEMDVDNDEDIDEKDLAKLRKKKLNKESVEEFEEGVQGDARRKISKVVGKANKSVGKLAKRYGSSDFSTNTKKDKETVRKAFKGVDKETAEKVVRSQKMKESAEELQELSKNTLRKYIGKNVAATMHTNSDDIPKNRKKGLKTAYDKLNKESYIEEKLSVEDGVKAWIDDFIKSDDPRFEGKSKAERREMALGAYYSAKKGK